MRIFIEGSVSELRFLGIKALLAQALYNHEEIGVTLCVGAESVSVRTMLKNMTIEERHRHDGEGFYDVELEVFQSQRARQA